MNKPLRVPFLSPLHSKRASPVFGRRAFTPEPKPQGTTQRSSPTAVGADVSVRSQIGSCLTAVLPRSRDALHSKRVSDSTKGSILVICLWVMAFLVILAVALNNIVSTRIIFTKHFRDTNQTFLLAKAGIVKAQAELKKESLSSWYDCLNEPWSNSPELFNEIALGEGTYTLSYGDPPEGYGMIDEERKININRNWVGPVRNLFKYLAGLSDNEALSIANSIADWRDKAKKGEPEEPREGGAEDDYYQGLESPYPCKNANFQVLEELLLVKGVTPEIFEKVKDYLTIYGGGKVNINTALLPVLISLGLTESLVNKVIRFRAGVDGQEGTPDDNICTKAVNIVAQINKVEPLSPEEIGLLNNLVVADYITVESKYYRIRTEGKYRGKFTKEITCIAERGGKIVYWVE